MAEQTDWTMLLIWMIICGFFRGAAFINFTITISEYSPLEKLPAAFGLHMVGKGLFVVALGPILGKINFITHSVSAVSEELFFYFRTYKRCNKELPNLSPFPNIFDNVVLYSMVY